MPHSPMAHDMGMGMGIAHNLNLNFKLFQNIFFEKTYKISFNILGLLLFYVLNTIEPLGIPKTHQKEQKSHFQGAENGSRSSKSSSKIFFVGFWSKNFSLASSLLIFRKSQ